VPDIGTNKNKEFWMPRHTRVCVTATGAVLLDLKRNRYFGLGYREARSLSTLATNWATASISAGRSLEPMELVDAARLADALVKAGFLTPQRTSICITSSRSCAPASGPSEPSTRGCCIQSRAKLRKTKPA
jgi:hypothetical protein